MSTSLALSHEDLRIVSSRARYYQRLPRPRERKEQLKDIARQPGDDNAEAARRDLFHEFPDESGKEETAP